MSKKKDVMNRLLKQRIDYSIIKYIDDSIVGIEDKLEVAATVYVKLSEMFWYSPKFVVDNDYRLIEDLNKITLEHNEIVCLHWAIIYSKLLDRYGIYNELIGSDEHLMVKVVVDKYVLFTDATKYGFDEKEYQLADLTNAKLGIKVKNFSSLSDKRNEEIDVVLNRVYERLGIVYYDDERLERLLNKFHTYTRKRIANNLLNEGYKFNREDILYRVRFINWFYKMKIKLREVERLQFFAKYYMKVFEGFNYENCRCLTLCETNEKYHLIRLLVVEDDSKKDYYFLETENGYIEYNKDNLIEEFLRRGIVFKYDICGVLGFKDSEVKMLSKRRK